MATKKVETTNAAEHAAEKKAMAAESEYTAAELAEAAQTVFGIMPECVSAALKCAGVNKATLANAKEIVKKFMNKEVR